jgi:hypothetical protein
MKGNEQFPCNGLGKKRKLSLRTNTVRALHTTGVQVSLPPKRTDAVVQQVGDEAVDHAFIFPYIARWLV